MRRGKRSAPSAGLGAWYRNGQAGLLIPCATSYDPRFDDSGGAITMAMWQRAAAAALALCWIAAGAYAAGVSVAGAAADPVPHPAATPALSAAANAAPTPAANPSGSPA